MHSTYIARHCLNLISLGPDQEAPITFRDFQILTILLKPNHDVEMAVSQINISKLIMINNLVLSYDRN